MRIIAIAIVCGILSTASTAVAAPSLLGPTGLIDTPSADSLRPGQFSLGVHKLNRLDTVSLTMNLRPQLELGVAQQQPRHGNNQTTLNAKWSFVPETILTPGLAVGIEGVGDGRSSAYAVVSKGLPLGFRLHAGVGTGRFDHGFGAVELMLNPMGVVGSSTFPTTTLIAEYDGDAMNYGVRVATVPGLKFEAGWRDSKSYFGASYTF